MNHRSGRAWCIALSVCPSNRKKTALARVMIALLLTLPIACPSCIQQTQNHSPSGTDSEAVNPSVLQAPWNKVTRIELRTDRRVVLEKKPSWTITEPFAYPVRTEMMNDLLGALSEITVIKHINEPITPRFGFGKEAIEVKAYQNEVLLSHFEVGYASDKDTYVRSLKLDSKGKQPSAMLVQGLVRRVFARTFSDLRAADIVTFKPEDVVKITYTNEDNVVMLERGKNGLWRGVDNKQPSVPFDSDSANNAVNVLCHLKARGFVDPPLDQSVKDATGLFDKNTATARVQLQDGTRQEFWFGSVRRDLLHVRTSSSDQIYLVAAYLQQVLTSPTSLPPPSLAKAENKADRNGHNEHRDQHNHSHQRGPAPTPTTVDPQILQQLRDIAAVQNQ